MRFVSVDRFLLRWIGALSLIGILTGNCSGGEKLQDWLDSMSALAESYAELAARATVSDIAEVGFAESMPGPELQCQREEALLDCLANRLLAEEYQPYDFDIRETLWCKGAARDGWSPACEDLPVALGTATGTANIEHPTKPESDLGPLLPAIPWIEALRNQASAEFYTQIENRIAQASIHLSTLFDSVLTMAAKIDLQIQENQLAAAPSLRDILGASVLPNQVVVTELEYTALNLEVWNELQAAARLNGILFHSRWYRFQSSIEGPDCDLAELPTFNPGSFPMAQR